MKAESKLPSMKFMQSALLYGLNANKEPKRPRNYSWLEKASIGLAFIFFGLFVLVSFLHHIKKPSDQILVYLLLPVTILDSVCFLIVFLLDGFRFVRRIAGNKGQTVLDLELQREDELAIFLGAFDSTACARRGHRLVVEVAIKKDLLAALGIVAVSLGALLATCSSGVIATSKIFSTYYPLAAVLIWLFTVSLGAMKLAGDIRVARRLAWVLSLSVPNET